MNRNVRQLPGTIIKNNSLITGILKITVAALPVKWDWINPGNFLSNGEFINDKAFKGQQCMPCGCTAKMYCFELFSSTEEIAVTFKVCNCSVMVLLFRNCDFVLPSLENNQSVYSRMKQRIFQGKSKVNKPYSKGEDLSGWYRELLFL